MRIRCIDTGEDTPTGGRLRRAAALLERDRFCLAYADAVADVDLGALIDHHDQAGAAATMAVVRPRLPFGVARLSGDGELVDGFDEKPVSEHWVNAGFFCLEPAVLSLLSDRSVLEREPLSALAGDGQLAAFRHHGFWHCMDTYKDAVALNDLWDADTPPPRGWPRRRSADGRRFAARPGGARDRRRRPDRLASEPGLLEQGAEVVVVRRDRPPVGGLALQGIDGRVHAVTGDICDEGLIARTLAEYEVADVFHLAAQTQVGVAARAPRSTFETNIRGTWLMLEACRVQGVESVIVASSDKAYGRDEQLPYTEERRSHRSTRTTSQRRRPT